MTRVSGPGGIVLLDGNPRPESRTVSIARRVVSALSDETGLAFSGEVTLSSLLPALAGTDPAQVADVDSAVAAATSAELLVVASPMYKASYTGLLKLFVDRFPRAALHEVVAVPVVTAGIAHHLLAAEVHLRPLLVELGADVPTRAFVLAESDFRDVDKAIARWGASAGVQLRRSLHRGALVDSR